MNASCSGLSGALDRCADQPWSVVVEVGLEGIVLGRVGEGELHWDAQNLRFTNSEMANAFVQEDYRKGWEVDGLS